MNLPQVKTVPVVIETSVGPIAVNVDSIGFFRWFHDGEKQAKWVDGRAMVRAALSERGRRNDDTDPAGAIVEPLSNDEIETIAQQMLAATTSLFNALPEEGDEPPSEILRRRMSRSVATSLEGLSKAVERIAPNFRTVSRQLSEMGGAIALAQQQLPLVTRMFQDSPTLRLIETFREMQPAYLRLAEAAQRSMADNRSALMQIQRLLDSERLIFPHPAVFSTQNILRQYAFNFPSYSIAAQALEVGILLPGYRLTAFAGLEGLAGQGAAADVLARYGSPAATNAPFFSSVRDAIEDFDLDEVPASNVEAWLQTIWEEAQRLLAAGGADIKKSGLVALLALFLSVVSLYYEVNDDSATTEDIRRVEEAVHEVTRGLGEFQSELREQHLQDRNIRYLATEAWLRATPARDGLRIRRIYPDQIVRVLDESDNWLQVEVYDYSGEAPIVGWMSRRVLRVRPVD